MKQPDDVQGKNVKLDRSFRLYVKMFHVCDDFISSLTHNSLRSRHIHRKLKLSLVSRLLKNVERQNVTDQSSAGKSKSKLTALFATVLLKRVIRFCLVQIPVMTYTVRGIPVNGVPLKVQAYYKTAENKRCEW